MVYKQSDITSTARVYMQYIFQIIYPLSSIDCKNKCMDTGGNRYWRAKNRIILSNKKALRMRRAEK